MPFNCTCPTLVYILLILSKNLSWWFLFFKKNKAKYFVIFWLIHGFNVNAGYLIKELLETIKKPVSTKLDFIIVFKGI